jgi:hypothetical protein
MFQASAYIPNLSDALNFTYKHSKQRSKLEGIKKVGHIADIAVVAISHWPFLRECLNFRHTLLVK